MTCLTIQVSSNTNIVLCRGGHNLGTSEIEIEIQTFWIFELDDGFSNIQKFKNVMPYNW